ncbi:hypothetical protein JCM8097_006377 [Rhodosporidiobolus ruineniae]
MSSTDSTDSTSSSSSSDPLGAAPGTPPSLVPLIGPVIMGQVATILFYGILVSVFTRFLGSKAWTRANWSLRITILFVVALSSAAVGLAIHDLWFYATLVTADPNVATNGTVLQAIEPGIVGLIALLDQVTLVLRVAKIVSNRYFRYIFMAVCFAGSIIGMYGACAMAAWSVSYHYNNYTDYTKELLSWQDVILLWLWSNAGVDLLITCVYIIALRKRLAGGTETTNNVLRLIILCAIRTAAYTSIFAMTAAILAQVFGLENTSNSLINYAFWEPLCVLYPLSLFTTLSIGDSIVNKLGDAQFRSSQRLSGMSGTSALPRFYVSDGAALNGNGVGKGLANGTGGRHGLHGIEGSSRPASRREIDLFADDDDDAELGGMLGRNRSNLSVGRIDGGVKGVMVQVEKEEKVETEPERVDIV